MKKIIKILLFSFLSLFVFSGCQTESMNNEKTNQEEDKIDSVWNLAGTQTYRGFTIDNVYHSANDGDIHYHLYVPEDYDGNTPYALYLSLCGYGGYYFQGVGINLRQESFVFEAQKYNSEMIIVAPQLTDWGLHSANQTIALTEYLMDTYNINTEKVFANGYSGGGETLSLVMTKRPELFTAVLHISSIWDGELMPLVYSQTPIYFVIGEEDEYYGSSRIKATYDTLCTLYKEQGMNDEQISAVAVLDIKNESYFTKRNALNQHGGGALFAFDSQIMGWLFNR